MRDTARTAEAILARLIPRMTGNLDSGQFWPVIESNVRMADQPLINQITSLLQREELRSCPRENLARSRALFLVPLDPAICGQVQWLRSSLKKSQRKHALYPRFAGQA